MGIAWTRVWDRKHFILNLFDNLIPRRCFYENRDDCSRFCFHADDRARLRRQPWRRQNGRQKSRLLEKRKREEPSLRQEVIFLGSLQKPLLRGFFTPVVQVIVLRLSGVTKPEQL